MEERIKVSVIVPVFNVENYIERCVRSLMEQTMKDCIEFIFVDDKTLDWSIQIIKEIVSQYPNRVNQVVYAIHDINKGLPAARNTGLNVARGEYIYHCDSDDYLDVELLESLYSLCASRNLDWAYCDFYLTFGTNERRIDVPSTDSSQQALAMMLSGRMKYNVWNKLIRRSLYEGLTFPEGRSMGEDMTILKVVMNAKSVGHIPNPLYHYVQYNQGAMSHNYEDDAKLDALRRNTQDTVEFIRLHSSTGAMDELVNQFLLNVKLPFLFTGNKNDYARWQNWFPESNSYIWRNKLLPLRTRIVQWAAHNELYFFVKVYNIIINKFIYGLLYK